MYEAKDEVGMGDQLNHEVGVFQSKCANKANMCFVYCDFFQIIF